MWEVYCVLRLQVGPLMNIEEYLVCLYRGVQNTFTLSVRMFKNEKRFGENNGMFWVSFQYVARKMYNVISEACKLLQDDLHSGTICF